MTPATRSADRAGDDRTRNERKTYEKTSVRIRILPASHAPKKGRPRWPGFLTRRRQLSVRLPRLVVDGATANRCQPSDGTRVPERLTGTPSSVRKRNCLQWRDRVGFAPTSRGRRGE